MNEPSQAERLSVIFCCDSNYLVPLAAALVSLARHHIGPAEVDVILFSDGISRSNQAKLFACIEAYPRIALRCVNVDPSLLAQVRPLRRVTRAAYLRLFVPHLLPRNCRRAIYLDADVLVSEDIEHLWRLDTSGCVLMACQDYANLVSTPGLFPNHKILMIPGTCRYLNSGVMLIDLDRWRDANVTERCLAYLSDFADTRVFNDQEAINAILFRDWKPLERFWNQQESFFETVFPGVIRRWLRTVSRQAAACNEGITHYCGARKPWDAGYLGTGRQRFYACIDQTPWHGWRVSRLADISVIVRRDLPRLARTLVPRWLRTALRWLRGALPRRRRGGAATA